MTTFQPLVMNVGETQQLQTAPANGQIPIGNGTNFTLANLTSSNANQITVSSGGGSIALGFPGTVLQDSNYSASKWFAPTFADATTNQKVDVYLSGTQSFWGMIEVSIVDAYSGQDAAGIVTKRFFVGLNAANVIYENESRYVEDGGLTADNYAISDLRWDATNSRYYITIVHRVSTANSPIVMVRGFGQSATYVTNFLTFSLGAVYTTDTTAYARPLIAFNNNVVLKALISTYNNIATVSNGVPSELATVDLAGQSAAIADTTIYTPTASGLFRISAYLQVTTPATISSVLGGATGLVIKFNDGDGNVAQANTVALMTAAGAIATTAAGNTTTTNLDGSIVIYAKTGVAIKYAIGYTSSGLTAMQFAAHLKVEAL